MQHLTTRTKRILGLALLAGVLVPSLWALVRAGETPAQSKAAVGDVEQSVLVPPPNQQEEAAATRRPTVQENRANVPPPSPVPPPPPEPMPEVFLPEQSPLDPTPAPQASREPVREGAAGLTVGNGEGLNIRGDQDAGVQFGGGEGFRVDGAQGARVQFGGGRGVRINGRWGGGIQIGGGRGIIIGDGVGVGE